MEVDPSAPPAYTPFARPAGDAIEMGPIAGPDTGGNAVRDAVVSDETGLAGSPLPLRPWRCPKAPLSVVRRSTSRTWATALIATCGASFLSSECAGNTELAYP